MRAAFHPLRVADVEPLCDDAVAVTFAPGLTRGTGGMAPGLLVAEDGKDADIMMFDKDLKLTYVMQMGKEITNKL